MRNNGLLVLIVLLDALGFALITTGVALAHNEVLAPEKALGLANLGGLVLLLSIVVVHLLVMRKVGVFLGLIMMATTFCALAVGAAQTPLFRLPWINDISTDHETPPPVVLPGVPGEPALPPHFVPLLKEHYADLKPLICARPPAEVLRKAAEVVKALPGVTEVRVDEARGLVHALEITPLMRFRDDFVIRVKPEGAGSRVDVRSRSRVGKSDLGANAHRIRRLLAAIQRAAA